MLIKLAVWTILSITLGLARSSIYELLFCIVVCVVWLFILTLVCVVQDRERDVNAAAKSDNWCSFLAVLGRLASADANYFSLSFITERSTRVRLLRKEVWPLNLSSMNVCGERRREEGMERGREWRCVGALSLGLLNIPDHSICKRRLLVPGMSECTAWEVTVYGEEFKYDMGV